MIANRFANDMYDTYNSQEENLFLQVKNNSPKPSRSSRRTKHPDSPRDFLANRVSFYMDDGIASSNDEVDTSLLALHRQHSNKRALPRSMVTRDRSFRVNERKQIQLRRHASDVSPSTRTQKLQRKRSTNGSRRQQGRRGSYGGYVERSESRTTVRTGSYRSTGSGNGKLRRQESAGASAGSKRSSTRRNSGQNNNESSFKLPHKELPPKERRRRIVVLMVVFTFLFLVICSVLVVVVTLTHSSFHRNGSYLPDKAEHLYPNINDTETVRKENEEMVNAINREEGGEDNDTAVGVAAGSSPIPLGL